MRTNNRQTTQDVSKSKDWPLHIIKSAIGAISKITTKLNVKPENRKMNFGSNMLNHNPQGHELATVFNLSTFGTDVATESYKLASHAGLNMQPVGGNDKRDGL